MDENTQEQPTPDTKIQNTEIINPPSPQESSSSHSSIVNEDFFNECHEAFKESVTTTAEEIKNKQVKVINDGFSKIVPTISKMINDEITKEMLHPDSKFFQAARDSIEQTFIMNNMNPSDVKNLKHQNKKLLKRLEEKEQIIQAQTEEKTQLENAIKDHQLQIREISEEKLTKIKQYDELKKRTEEKFHGQADIVIENNSLKEELEKVKKEKIRLEEELKSKNAILELENKVQLDDNDLKKIENDDFQHEVEATGDDDMEVEEPAVPATPEVPEITEVPAKKIKTSEQKFFEKIAEKPVQKEPEKPKINIQPIVKPKVIPEVTKPKIIPEPTPKPVEPVQNSTAPTSKSTTPIPSDSEPKFNPPDNMQPAEDSRKEKKYVQEGGNDLLYKKRLEKLKNSLIPELHEYAELLLHNEETIDNVEFCIMDYDLEEVGKGLGSGLMKNGLNGGSGNGSRQ